MVHQITLMDAYLIETLRSKGVSNEEILSKVKSEQLADFKSFHASFDFTLLYELANGSEHIFEEILKDGYQITFLTFPGLKNLLQLKFNKLENEDYVVEDFVISNLKLTENEEKELHTFLATNWTVESEGESFVIKPVNHKL